MRLSIINKRPYAVGLMWFTPDTQGKGGSLPLMLLRKLATREAAQQASGLDLVAFRTKQFGLGSSSAGGDASVWMQARSLAAAFKAPSSFLGLFQLEDVQGHAFWWVYASKAGVLSEQADALFDDYDTAKTYINQSLVSLLGEFDECVECASHAESQNWLAPLLRVGPLGSVLALYDPCRLTPVRQTPEHRRKAVAIAMAVAVLGVGLYAVSAFFEHRAAQQALEAARLATLNKERRLAELMQHPEQVFPPLWATAPRADALAGRCMQALLAQPTVVSGWELVNAGCAATGERASLSLTWEHRTGANFLLLPPTATLVGTNRAVMHLPLTLPPAPRTDGDYRTLLARETATRTWYQLIQQLGSRLRLDIAPPATSTVDGIKLIAPWQRGTWELADVPDAVLLDGSLAATLSTVPGLVVEHIAFDGAWTLKGVLYVQK